MAGTQAWLVGLAVASTVLAYPLFNQVKDTSLRALEDADHGGTIDKIPKFLRDRDGDGFPDDEELEYWNGRMPDGEEYGPDGDIDGDGVPNDEDEDADGDGKSDGEEVRLGRDPGEWEDYEDEDIPPPANFTDEDGDGIDDGKELQRVRDLLMDYDARDENEPPVLSHSEDFSVFGYETIEVTVNVTDYRGSLELGVEAPGGSRTQRTIQLSESAGSPQDRVETFPVIGEGGTWNGFVEGNAIEYAQVRIEVHGIRWVEEGAAE
jgi:hypothetical protein